MPYFAVHGATYVTLACSVFGQKHRTLLEDSFFTATNGDFYSGIKVNNVLAARRRVEVVIVVTACLPKNNACGWENFGNKTGFTRGYVYFDVFEM
jgi:hypothetical protein